MRHSCSPWGQTRLLYKDKAGDGLSCVANRPSLAAQLGEIPAGLQGHDSLCQNSRARLYLVRIQQRGRARQERLRPEKAHKHLHSKTFPFQLLSSF